MCEKLTLNELQIIIRDSLYLALPDLYWIVAEIAEIRENFSGHCYLELVEKQPDDKNVRARARAVIWNNRYRVLKPFFENITGESLKQGLKILVRVKVEYHEIYGLSLVVSDIDPSFTYGEMAIKRQLIIQKLGEEGVLEMNKELSFPAVPQRIAVISSGNAAGYSDFINHLKGNKEGYVFYTVLFDTAMQGTETEQSVIGSLDRIASVAQMFDVVAIIRGGGSTTDLSWFDNYNIAYLITQFPLPVLTGIGHEKDMSVTDLVAWKALKTPTAVADYLVECVITADNHLAVLSIAIADNSRLIIERNRNRTDNCRMKLIPVAGLLLSEIKDDISVKIIRTVNICREHLKKAGQIPHDQRTRLLISLRIIWSAKGSLLMRQRDNLVSLTSGSLKINTARIRELENALEMIKPDNVLRRGYTITSKSGKILRSRDESESGEIIETMFIDGKLKSRVV
jgi:exodeoxyribonuclease VII large subunit